jgi:hypothetical protein
MIGDIDWDQMSKVGRTEAGIWLWMYIIIVVLLMLNMIIAIIMDHYEAIKNASGHAETLWEEGKQMVYRFKGMRAGTYVALERVLDAVNDDMRRTKLAQKKDPGRSRRISDGSPEDGNAATTLAAAAQAVDVHNKCICPGDLQKFVGRLPNHKMREEQAIEVLVGAIEDFYDINKKGAELDEVVQTTQRVNYRTKKLVKAARRAHENRDTGPVRELEEFAKNVHSYLEEVRKERDANSARLDQLKSTKKHLETRLTSLGGGFVKSDSVSVTKKASIARTVSRMATRPPALD